VGLKKHIKLLGNDYREVDGHSDPCKQSVEKAHPSPQGATTIGGQYSFGNCTTEWNSIV